VIPTGSIGLNAALGVGGYPKGRIIEIFGPESSGKTTLAIHAIAEAQKAGGIAAFIDAYALEATGIDGIASALGCSRRTVESRYRAAYGQSVGAAILARRFAEVERLLANPRQTLAAIANMCGWKSSAHLMRSFRSRYGMTMSEWRARLRPTH
jgi:AraC-like DNA-binding protein